MSSNIPQSIKTKIGIALHNKTGHPIKIVKDLIYKYFDGLDKKFDKFDDLKCQVKVADNFDLLLIPSDHPSRSRSDTYYLDNDTVLRTHTSAHQNELLEKGYTNFLVSGDVYRKDEIDARHYPIFHQMEGVCLTDDNTNPEDDLKKVLSGLVEYLLPGKEYRFGNDYFPFTDPSFEIEVKFGDRWLEILGCGVIHTKILDRLNIKQRGWALGIGLERIAMILFDIPDIRLFWTDDKRFMDQFKEEKIVTFKPYSKVEPLIKDISFWIDEKEVKRIDDKKFDWLNINDFYEQVREICGDSIASVSVLDQFYHTKHKKYSMTFRLLINSNDYKIEDHAKVTEHANSCIKAVAASLTKLGYTIR
jgi:phenylalanyl-tRNA synthetase alpha chain